MANIKNYLSLVKFSHSIFAMPFALFGFFLALHINELSFDYWKLIYVILCMVLARNTAMGFNRYIDREIDKKNPRTQSREIPSGKVSEKAALFFVIINALLFIVTTYFINTLALILSPVALAVVMGYSYTKRFTSLCHVVLGLALALSPIGAYIAVTGSFNSIIPVLVSFSVLLWTAGFDIIYALQDDEFDSENGLFSIPGAIGRKKALILSRFLHFASSILLLVVGLMLGFNTFYLIGYALFTALLLNQHRLVKVDDLSKVNLAFFTMNGIASVIFGIFAVVSVW